MNCDAESTEDEAPIPLNLTSREALLQLAIQNVFGFIVPEVSTGAEPDVELPGPRPEQ